MAKNTDAQIAHKYRVLLSSVSETKDARLLKLEKDLENLKKRVEKLEER